MVLQNCLEFVPQAIIIWCLRESQKVNLLDEIYKDLSFLFADTIRRGDIFQVCYSLEAVGILVNIEEL